MCAHYEWPFLAELSHESPIIIGSKFLSESSTSTEQTAGVQDGSSEGGQQGWNLAAFAFCYTIHPAAILLNEELSQGGGMARFGQDDFYARAPEHIL